MKSDHRDLQQRTIAHYEAFPFDFMTPEDEAAIEAMQPPPFRAFIAAHGVAPKRIAEIGCGPGRGTMYLCRKKLDVTAVDISARSLALARARARDAQFVRASNLELPLPAATFDLVVSDGVIHHTPDAKTSLRENVRILRENGHLYLGVYNRHGYYYYIYNWAGPPSRWLERFLAGRVLIYAAVFPVYYLAHLIKSRGKRTLRGTVNFFYDYIITPRASFHSRADITAWGEEMGLELLGYDPSLGNVHVFVFRKMTDRVVPR